LPSTSGTGAEVTPFATIWDNAQRVKRSLSGDFLYPQTALVDPELTLSLPWTTTLYCGLDAISHALESLWNRNATPVSVLLANEALRLASKALPALEEDLGNVDLRENMQRASLLAGLAISQNRTAIAHAISYPFTLRFGVPHGLACSFTLQAVGRLVGDAWSLGTDRDTVAKTMMMLERFKLKHVMTGYCTLAQALQHIEEMFTPGRADNLAVPVDANTVASLLRQSLAGKE
jgi:alcohol dehydrogenase